MAVAASFSLVSFAVHAAEWVASMLAISFLFFSTDASLLVLASNWAAFKAAEAGQVGACFEKLVAFIKANTPQPEEAPADDNAVASQEK